uniref:Uncharacterized protein n=1 Tax=Cairina moschata TaxID=8855 RepID=A0A8C3C1J4_CAIMO
TAEGNTALSGNRKVFLRVQDVFFCAITRGRNVKGTLRGPCSTRCPSLKLPLSPRGAPGSPLLPDHFTDTWPAFWGTRRHENAGEFVLMHSPGSQRERHWK